MLLGDDRCWSIPEERRRENCTKKSYRAAWYQPDGALGSTVSGAEAIISSSGIKIIVLSFIRREEVLHSPRRNLVTLRPLQYQPWSIPPRLPYCWLTSSPAIPTISQPTLNVNDAPSGRGRILEVIQTYVQVFTTVRDDLAPTHSCPASRRQYT